jgi:hypothetical protein
MNQTAKQRAALIVLEALARTPTTIPHAWSAEEVAEVKIELTKIELGLRGIAVGRDSKVSRAMGRETGRQVRVRGVKGVK